MSIQTECYNKLNNLSAKRAVFICTDESLRFRIEKSPIFSHYSISCLAVDGNFSRSINHIQTARCQTYFSHISNEMMGSTTVARRIRMIVLIIIAFVFGYSPIYIAKPKQTTRIFRWYAACVRVCWHRRELMESE